MSKNDMPPEMTMFCLGAVVVVAVVIGTVFRDPPAPRQRPAPKPIEQVREERNEKFNEAGKSLHEMARGMLGLDKSKKEPVAPTPAAKPLPAVEPTK